MLRLSGPSVRYCDGQSRRTFLQLGGLALGGLTLPQLLLAEQQRKRVSHKSVIVIYLSGGIAHQDTFDIKTEAPKEIRGEFQAIETNVPGIRISEHLPKLAQCMDKFSIIRSVVGQRDEHSSFHNLTGFPMGESQRERKPHMGSVISRVQGPTAPIIPPFVDLFPTMQHRPYNSPASGYMGRSHGGVRADGENLASMRLRYISEQQFSSRQNLLKALDDCHEHYEKEGVEAMDVAYRRAFDVLTSSTLIDALDVEKENPQVRERYGKGSSKHLGDGAPMWNDQLLIARRLVEAGVRIVTVAYGFWDTHGNNFGHMKEHLPLLDTGFSALFEDIYSRGLQEDVAVCVCGEFGRTPKINKDAGRDHWPRVNSALFSGGGMKTGQVIGSTDKIGDSAASRPVHYQDVIATMYKSLGLDPHEFIRDETDRPVQILPESAHPISELF